MARVRRKTFATTLAACLSLAPPFAAAPPPAPTIEIAPGVHLPLVSLGTAEYDGAELTNVTRMALAMGYVGIDNDDGGRGTDMGNTLRELAVPRHRFFLTAKVNGGQTKAQTALSLESEYKALGLKQIDLLLLHHPTPAPGLTLNETLQQQWAALEDFYRSHRVRAIGVSNFCRMAFAALEETAVIMPAVNQIMFHAGMGDDPDGIRSFALSGAGLGPARILPMGYSAIDQGNPAILEGKLYLEIAKRYGVTAAQVALRWITQHDPPVPFVVAASDPTYLSQNLDLFGFTLSAQEMTAISAEKSCHAGSDHDRSPCLPYWPGGACNPCCCTAPPMHVGCCCTNSSGAP